MFFSLIDTFKLPFLYFALENTWKSVTCEQWKCGERRLISSDVSSGHKWWFFVQYFYYFAVCVTIDIFSDDWVVMSFNKWVKLVLLMNYSANIVVFPLCWYRFFVHDYLVWFEQCGSCYWCSRKFELWLEYYLELRENWSCIWIVFMWRKSHWWDLYNHFMVVRF